MAAIIAQMTRANRERQKRKKNQIVISKCMYEINEYPEKFVPEKHNKYLRARRLYVATQEAEEKCYQLVTKRLSEIEYEKTKNKPFPWWTFLTESMIILTALGLVPMIISVILWTWPEQIDV